MKAMNYRQFEAEVRATKAGRDLQPSKVYHLFMLYRAANLISREE